MFMKNLSKNIQPKLHLYADNTILYISDPSAAQEIEELQALQETMKSFVF